MRLDFFKLQGMTYGEKMAKTEAVECFSLYDISAIVYTKSTHRIILPMIAELYNLIIAIEQREITHEAFANLETTAEELAKATEELGCIAGRLAEKSGDEVLEKEMVPATQTLLVSGKNILLAVQKLLIQPDACTSVEELAVSAKRILVATIKTKEEVIATAIQVIAGGEALVKFAGRITKDCLNERCAAELLCALEKTKTINYQLSIITRVIASTGGSRSSVEHLISNAQNLFQGVLQMFMAAEAACVKGLQHPSPDTEESNTATFCSQWRKSLRWYGAKESLNSDKEELGLCKTGLWPSPLSPL